MREKEREREEEVVRKERGEREKVLFLKIQTT